MAIVKENLIAAKALIDTPEKWIKGSLQNAEETCFCTYGAAAKVARTFPHKSGMDSLLTDALADALPDSFLPDPNGILSIAQFNDDPSTTHADIMALFDRAIDAQDAS